MGKTPSAEDVTPAPTSLEKSSLNTPALHEKKPFEEAAITPTTARSSTESPRDASQVEKYGAGPESSPLPDLKRKLKSRHLQMIAIGKYNLVSFPKGQEDERK